MKAVYIAKKSEVEHSGYSLKIDGQVKALNDLGITMTLLAFEKVRKWQRMLPFQTGTIWCRSIWLPKDINGLYIRYQRSDYQFIQFLKRARAQNKNIKIVVEIPTYPYDKEKVHWLRKVRDKLYRKKMKKYVDKIAILAECAYVFGIPTIRIMNGIDLEKIKMRNCMESREHNGRKIIRFCMVAHFEPWHGIDRFLKGMEIYYKNEGKEHIELHLAGDGLEMPNIKKIISDCSLEKYVILHGEMESGELDKLYDKCDIAIGSLGAHRKDIFLSSELKSREYLAKGIPFIYSCAMDIFEKKEVDFAFQCPADESFIKIDEVISFYNNLLKKESIESLSKRIREYAEKTIDMKEVMKPVAEYFGGEDYL